MNKIYIIEMDYYLDGGTLSFKDENGVEYCKDNRFEKDPDKPGYTRNVSTAGKWFLGYPNDNSNVINDLKIIDQLEEFAKLWKIFHEK